MEMWDRTKSSLARVSQLADIQDKPKNEDIEFEIFHCEYFQNIKQNNVFKTIRENKANTII